MKEKPAALERLKPLPSQRALGHYYILPLDPFPRLNLLVDREFRLDSGSIHAAGGEPCPHHR